MRKIIVTLTEHHIYVRGATYHVRHILRMLGFRFNKQTKEWVWRGRNIDDVDEKHHELDKELKRCGCRLSKHAYDVWGSMDLVFVYLCPFR